MTDWKIPLYKIYTDDEDLNLITKIIKRGKDWALGPEIEELENTLKNYVGTDYCITLNSGTSALHSTLLAYEIGTNDEVIVPSFSFISTVNSVLFVNGTPKFSDIEEITYGLDPKLLSQQITPKTKVIMPMDYGGMSCQINEIKKIAEQNNLILIEDAAESLGSSVKGKKTGSIADSSIFSFCGNKVLTTGEGGAVVTNSKEVYEKIKLIRSHGRLDKKSYFENPSMANYLQLGYNWRMSSMTAALGISQLHKLDKIIKMRQNNAVYISERLKKIPEIQVPSPPNDYDHIYQMYSIRLANNQIREKLHEFLLEKSIFSKVYFYPIHKTSFYQNQISTIDSNLPVTESVSNEILTLPMYPNMTNEEKNYLVQSIYEFFETKQI
ncbi:MAG: DegT/DnrJ/EryC1/StrS family aminotransferase [Thaumarchaeota archaeon]|jgi:perosamine synthetase|nr:MAG: DegT/DnrJ/EryC1/StrS family aminotransferase [Nitrososphaerota archaeon]